MHLLLINPKFPESFWSFRWAIDQVLPGKRAVNPPLGLATLAALCPAHWHVEIIDENIEPVPLETKADIVGICGMGVQMPRQRELLVHFRRQGHYVVAGGSYASLCHGDYAEDAHTVVAGEAEYVWKEFCRDFEAGCPKSLYHETGTVALADSPVPRFDLLKLGVYSNVTLQFSRGCPYRCEFCDIIVMFGRRPRVKGLDQIERELDQLRRFGARSVFFVDDNLIGNPKEAKELLRFLAAYQRRHDYFFSFGTEASLNMAQDDELLDLFSAANFGWVFIGIETTDPEGLKETGKVQNLREDPLTAVRRIYAHGIDVLGGFIIGFDHDTMATFEHQYRFITDAGIQSAMIGLLMALPRTPLHERMQREGRLLPLDGHADNTCLTTNIAPRSMNIDAMVAAYQELYRRLLTGPEIGRRIRNKMKYLQAPVYGSGYSMGQRAGILARLMVRGIGAGGLSTLVAFLRSFPFLTPSRIPMVISDWIIGLSMKAFAETSLLGRSTQGLNNAATGISTGLRDP
ncbi:hypothetical protein CCC_04212 [Paramagnetospirillum magnetotacticum MS-1]|uniref:Radical SAM core domain-containing protein n=1 Tax=Paramagnetospirillum magnetotacticum MS-1 TaxID=272627 RepID=A0A0C2V2X8_PARME|nr:radical SAM protein [Paramagnetospirillum magnetotacticum]KIL99441.1 hypothetical protein CCC_04212 [Paramagnetospirillum magnetotacticum MS-1]